MSIRALWRSALVLGLGAAFVAATPSGATSADPADHSHSHPHDRGTEHEHGDETVRVLDADEAWDETAAGIAASSDGEMSHAEALSALARQEAFHAAIDVVWTHDSATYGGAYVDDDGNRVLRTVGPLPADVLSNVHSALPSGASVDDSAPFSLEEMYEATRLVSATLREGDREIVASFDPATQEVVVELASDDPRSDSVLRASTSDLSVSESRKVFPEIAFKRSELVTLAGVDNALGGDRLESTSGSLRCTTGFGVTSSGGDGVMTAGHCGNPDNVYEHIGGNLHFTWTLGEHVGQFGDFEWRWVIGQPVADDFYSNTTTLTDVSSVKNWWYMSPGDAVCRYGRNTGQDCSGEIIKVGVSANGVDSLVEVDYWSGGGDSGGPVFVGGQAWGIHKGYLGSGNRLFSIAMFGEAILGVTIKT